jgi:hypothetical protein
VVTATAATNFELTTTNSDNINDRDPYKFFANARIINNLPETPLPVTVEVNGAQVPLWDKYDEQILSSAIPRRAFGYYTTAQGAHVSLINTPETVIIP